MNTIRTHSGRLGTGRHRGFTLIEILIVVLILAIVATLVAESAANAEATQRTDRAAREVIAALRYARAQAMATGTTCGVEFSSTAGQFRVYQMNGTVMTTMPYAMGRNGSYLVQFSNAGELKGVTMTCWVNNDGTDPYAVAYGPLGATTNNGTVTLYYGSARSSSVQIPAVGDAK